MRFQQRGRHADKFVDRHVGPAEEVRVGWRGGEGGPVERAVAGFEEDFFGRAGGGGEGGC